MRFRDIVLLAMVVLVLFVLFVMDSQSQTPTSITSVTASATVVTDKGAIVTNPDLTKDNFRVYQCKNAKKRKDCVEQPITGFTPPKETITVIMALDYSGLAFQISCAGNPDPYGCGYYGEAGEIQNAPIAFLQNLRPEDWAAFVWYDIRSHIGVDFTKNKNDLVQELYALLSQPPAFYESNLFDTAIELLDRIDMAEKKDPGSMNRVSIVLISTGIDTFSKNNFKELQKRAQNTAAVIYPVRIGKSLQYRSDGYMDGASQMALLQAESQLRTLADLTGGKLYSPAFPGELPGIFSEISDALRAQYTIEWTSNAATKPGSFNEIRIEVEGVFQDAETQKPLKVGARHRKGHITQEP
ncbi:MAG: hypothetical protein Q8Q39_02755 [bacterium]|nr:hypothetical protein [bacterium]